MAGFVILDLVLLCCLLTPVTGLNAAPHFYRLTDRPIFVDSGLRTTDVPKPSPVGFAVRPAAPSTHGGIVSTPALVGVNK